MFHTSQIEINSNALKNNLDFIQSFLKPTTVLSAVVKGNAYGHGIEVFVPLAESLGINHFSVFEANEALRVSKVSNGKSTILIMGSLDNDELEWAILNDVEFFVFELDRLEKAIEVSQKVNKQAQVHIEIETGMNRTGFSKEEINQVIALLHKYPNQIHFKGLCTHFAGAESIANYARIRTQKKEYLKTSKYFTKKGLTPELKHVSCSAAAIRYPEVEFDMVRVGILLYGFWPTKEVFIEYSAKQKEKTDPLKRLISWKSKVMSVKEIAIGEFIGYGTTYLAHQNMKIAIVPVGYSHGFSRKLSNQGRVLIKGNRLSVVGIVNMNCVAIDVSAIDNVRKGDEVVLIGKQEENIEVTISSFGELSNQMNYELLVRLPQDIPRIII